MIQQWQNEEQKKKSRLIYRNESARKEYTQEEAKRNEKYQQWHIHTTTRFTIQTLPHLQKKKKTFFFF